jgi:DNA-binding NarL/FixJ family response regulator
MLMDVRMPVIDGIDATGRIVADEATEAVRVIVLTTFDLDDYVYRALRAGASGSCSRTPRRNSCWTRSGSWQTAER